MQLCVCVCAAHSSGPKLPEPALCKGYKPLAIPLDLVFLWFPPNVVLAFGSYVSSSPVCLQDEDYFLCLMLIPGCLKLDYLA